MNKLPAHFLRLLFSCLVIISSGSSSLCHAENNPVAKIPIIQIQAEGLSPLDIGLEIGKKTKLLFSDIEQRYDAYLSSSLSQMRFDDILSDRLPKLRQYIDDTYQKELEGIASTWSLVHKNKLGDGLLSWDEYWLLNLLPDIGFPANGTGFGVLPKVSKEKGSIIGRNLDFNHTVKLRSLQTITVYQYANKSIVNIGFAGVISVITGFNESGLFVAHFNAASDSSYQNSFQFKKTARQEIQSHGFALRKALENFTTTSKATSFLSDKDYGNSSTMLVADKKNIRVLEYSSNGDAEVRHWQSQVHADKQWKGESQIAVVDCHVLSSMTENCRRAKDTYRWERLRSLANFTSEYKAGTQDVSKIMLDSKNQYYEILGTDTLQSMIYLPASGHLYLYAAPANPTKFPPSYQVYYQDILPANLRNTRNKTHYFWWIAGLLLLMTVALWWVRRSLKRSSWNTPRMHEQAMVQDS